MKQVLTDAVCGASGGDFERLTAQERIDEQRAEQIAGAEMMPRHVVIAHLNRLFEAGVVAEDGALSALHKAFAV